MKILNPNETVLVELRPTYWLMANLGVVRTNGMDLVYGIPKDNGELLHLVHESFDYTYCLDALLKPTLRLSFCKVDFDALDGCDYILDCDTIIFKSKEIKLFVTMQGEDVNAIKDKLFKRVESRLNTAYDTYNTIINRASIRSAIKDSVKLTVSQSVETIKDMDKFINRMTNHMVDTVSKTHLCFMLTADERLAFGFREDINPSVLYMFGHLGGLETYHVNRHCGAIINVIDISYSDFYQPLNRLFIDSKVK